MSAMVIEQAYLTIMFNLGMNNCSHFLDILFMLMLIVLFKIILFKLTCCDSGEGVV